MKKLLYIIPLLLLPFSSIAQEQNIDETVKKGNTNYKNQVDLDVQLLGLGLNYKRSLSNKLSIGLGFNFGKIAVFKYDNNGSGFELSGVNGRVFVDYKISNSIHIHIGPKLDYVLDEINSDWFYGGELGIFYKIKHIEFGLLPFVGYTEKNTLVGIPLFIIRINLNKW
ncbi:MAG: hypothetical protein ACPGSO_07815 [Vicingaceae bacterium]